MPIAQYPDLSHKHVFITGGCSGIGAAMVEGFLQQQAKVSFVSNDNDSGNQLVERLSRHYQHPPSFVCCDVTDVAQLSVAIRQFVEQFGDVDVLINNAANDARHDLANLTVEQWDTSLNVNLRPHFFTAQSVAAGMRAKQQGSIINLSSNSALLGLSGYPAYVTAKAGIVGLTKALARELGTDCIRVNALVPGWVMTEKQKQLWVTPEALEQCLAEQCIPQTIEEQDIVDGALFLASNASRMITGQSLVIDGGRV